MTHRHQLVLYHTVTPLHVGCGQDVGVVDLPVIRERTTGYPFLPGSGTRGALRAAFPEAEEGATDWKTRLFGPEAEAEMEPEERYAGSVSIHDAKLLLLPVRSTPGVYGWITAPTPLRRLVRDLEAFGQKSSSFLPDMETLLPSADLAKAFTGDRFLGPEGLVDDGVLYLEEYPHGPVKDAPVTPPVSPHGLLLARKELHRWGAALGKLLGLEELPGRLVLVPDGSFSHFSRYATVIEQHNRLTSAKTVEGGALFSLEAVPPDAVFYGMVGAAPGRWVEEGEKAVSAEDVLGKLRANLWPEKGNACLLHLGGKESTGLGVTRLLWPAPPEPGAEGKAGEEG